MSKKAEVVTLAEKWATLNEVMRWSSVDNLSSLYQWYRKGPPSGESAIPTCCETTTLVCYEMPLLAAVTSGALSAQALYEIYRKNRQDHKAWTSLLNSSWINRTTSYSTATHSPIPARGDIVFFNDMGHVALATGRLLAKKGERAAGAEVVSFWGFGTITNVNKIDPETGEPRMYCMAQVDITSIDELVGIIVASPNSGGRCPVTFASPPW